MSEEEEEVKNVALNPGDCFGWFSSVSVDCHTSSCLRSDWCKSYTLNRANQSETSIKKDLEEIGKDSNERIKEAQVDKKTSAKEMVDLGKQAFFDRVVIIAKEYVKHDSVKISPKSDTASLKIGGRVVAFLARKRTEIIFELGGRGQGGPQYSVPFGENMENIKSQIEEFIEEHA